MKIFVKRLLSFLYNPIGLLKLKHFGKGSRIGKGLVVNGKKKRVFIGDKVEIGKSARLGNCSEIFIGNSCMIGTHFTALGNIHVSNGNLIASYVSIIQGNHCLNPEAPCGYMTFQPINPNNKILIESGCWIGEKATIISGDKSITIGEKCVIGACSVITTSIPPYSMVVGNPARIIKRYNLVTHCWEKVENEKQ